MGGFVKGVIDTVADAAEKSIKEVGRAAKDIYEFNKKALDKTYQWTRDTVDKTYKFAVNVLKGAYKDTEGMVKGAARGDWTTFRDSFVSIATAALYVAGAVAGVLTGNAALMTASTIALDGHYNQGMLTDHTVHTAGKIERESIGTETILRNQEYFTAAIIIVSSMYSAHGGLEFIFGLTGIQADTYQNYVNYFNTADGAYKTYEAYETYTKAEYEAEKIYKDYLKWLSEYEAWKKQQKDIFEQFYNDETLWYESQPGGYLFNAGVGSDEYVIGGINEQSAYSLMLKTDINRDFEKMFKDPFEIDYVNLGIDDYQLI